MKPQFARLMAIPATLLLVALAAAGTWSPNNFFYQPDLGARGVTEKGNFDTGLQRVDAHLGKYKTLGDPGYGTLAEALATIGSAQVTLTVPAGAVEVSGTVSIPGNISLRVFKGAQFNLADGAVLSTAGSIEAGDYQIFAWTGSGKVDMTNSPSVANACWWGAKGDGVTGGQDVPINAALAAAKRVYLPPSPLPYIIDSTIYVRSGREFYGKLYKTTIKPKNSFDTGKRFVQNYTTAPANDAARDSNLYIHDLSFDGNSANQGSTQFQACIELVAVKDAVVENISGRDNKGDIVHIAYNGGADVHSYNVTVRNIAGTLNQRNVVSVTGGEKVIVDTIYGEDCGLSVVDVEPDNNPYAICRDIVINNVIGRDIGKTFRLTTDYCYGVAISNSPPGPMVEQVTVSNVNIRNVYGSQAAILLFRGVKGLALTNLNGSNPGGYGIRQGEGEAAGGYSCYVSLKGVNLTDLPASANTGILTAATLSHFTLSDVLVQGAATYGVRIYGSQGALTNLNVRGGGTLVYAQCSDVVFTGGVLDGGGAGTGFTIYNSNRLTAAGLLVENCATGLLTSGTITDSLITDNNFYNNTTRVALYATETNCSFARNRGYVTENGGTAQIANGTTSLTVSHGCDYTPNPQDITITWLANPSTDPGHFWVSNITASQFTVNVRTNPGANLNFAWRVRR